MVLAIFSNMSLQFTTNLGFIPYTTGPGPLPGGGHGEPLQEALAAVAQCQGRHVAPGSPLANVKNGGSNQQ